MLPYRVGECCSLIHVERCQSVEESGGWVLIMRGYVHDEASAASRDNEPQRGLLSVCSSCWVPPTFPSTFSAPSWAACAAHRAVTSVSIRTGNTNIRITRWPESWRPSMAPERDAWWTRFLAVSASVAALTGLYWYMSTRDYTVKVSIVHLKDGKPI